MRGYRWPILLRIVTALRGWCRGWCSTATKYTGIVMQTNGAPVSSLLDEIENAHTAVNTAGSRCIRGWMARCR